MTGEDSFESRIPLELLEVLLDLGQEFSFDPVGSTELEDYFVNLLTQFKSTANDLSDWLRPRLAESFRHVTSAPRWIQGAEWQISRGRPMLFVGQVDVPPVDGVFHDDASFYVFLDPETGECRTIVQVS